MNTDPKNANIAWQDELPLVIVFVRHGQPGERNCSPDQGPDLTPLGRRQARRVAKRLAGERFDHIYTSNLRRAMSTAEAIKDFHRSTRYTVTRDAREITHYHFLPKHQSNMENPEIVAGETRVINAFAAQLRRDHEPGQTVLVVCHGNFIRSIMPILGGRDPLKSLLMDINHTAVTIIEAWRSGEAVLRLGNCVRHLLPRQVT